MSLNIGLNVQPPERECDDINCPFHGKLKVRGRIIDGEVVSNKMQSSIVVRKQRYEYVKKYKRYTKKSSRYTAHKPGCMDVEVGDKVKIAECRPISKTKSFVLIKVEKK